MRMIVTFLLLSCFSLRAQVTNFVIVVNDTNSPVVTTAGTIAEAQDYFIQGLEWGSGIAAILFCFMCVRRALSMGDAWND